MTGCSRCLYTTRHPFGLTLDEAEVCSGCRVHEEKTDLDWSSRLNLLEEAITKQPRRSKYYDCIVPVRGTPEHFSLLDIIINQLGFRPLLVAYNTQFNSHAGIQNIDLMRDTFDLDIEIYVSNPIIYKKLVRESLARFGSVRWPALAGMTQFPVRTAVDKGVPVIVWPYHQPTEQVGTHSYLELNEMTRRGRHEYDLFGVEPSAFLSTETLVKPLDVADIKYPSNRELKRAGVRGFYMANYVPWDSRLYSEGAIAQFGAVAASNPRTYDPYDRVDDMVYMTAHDLLKEAKLGYSRVTDTLCQELRFGRIDRDSAQAIEAHYRGQFPEQELSIFLDWLDIGYDAFCRILQQLPYGEEVLRGSNGTKLPPLAEAFTASFRPGSQSVHQLDAFTMFGKGIDE